MSLYWSDIAFTFILVVLAGLLVLFFIAIPMMWIESSKEVAAAKEFCPDGLASSHGQYFCLGVPFICNTSECFFISKNVELVEKCESSYNVALKMPTTKCYYEYEVK